MRFGRFCCRWNRLFLSLFLRRAALDLQTDQFGPDRDLLAYLAIDGDDLASARRGNFHRCLVGHDGCEKIILAHDIADLHMPFDEFGLGNAFTNVGQLDRKMCHLLRPLKLP